MKEESTITAKLQQDPSVDHVVTLGAPIALTAVQSVQNSGSAAKVVTFDTNAELVDAILSGDVQWAVGRGITRRLLCAPSNSA